MMVEGQIQLEASSGRMAQVEEPGLRGGEAGGGEGLGAVTEGKSISVPRRRGRGAGALSSADPVRGCLCPIRNEFASPIIHLSTLNLEKRLVARFSQIEGYRCLSLMRALGVVKCQFALVWLALRSCSQAAISSMRVCLSEMRRSRHWDDRTPSSDSARSSQLPCFGV